MTETWMLVCTERGKRYRERDVRYVCPACTLKQRPGDVTMLQRRFGLLSSRLQTEWFDAVGETKEAKETKGRPTIKSSRSKDSLLGRSGRCFGVTSFR